jgi:hypothetical protein
MFGGMAKKLFEVVWSGRCFVMAESATSAFMRSQDYAVENGGRFALVRVEDGETLASCERAKR